MVVAGGLEVVDSPPGLVGVAEVVGEEEDDQTAGTVVATGSAVTEQADTSIRAATTRTERMNRRYAHRRASRIRRLTANDR